METNHAADNMNAILSIDQKIYDRLYELGGGDVNAFESQKVISKLRSQRFLDKPPGNIKLHNSGIQSGCQELYRRALQSIVVESDTTEGIIDFAGKKIVADIYVIRALKALIRVGTSFDPELTGACRTLVMELVKLHGTAVTKVTKEYLSERLVATNYYEEKLAAVFFEEYPDR